VIGGSTHPRIFDRFTVPAHNPRAVTGPVTRVGSSPKGAG
jgi:hypothetical protein